ncbi:15184_t:CDS:10 [Funneliformis geosporum]|uniref:18272_t:CDS:1 n=1 Tax=Funneliformis geosporum TaxID=1117311 RepID=A0A9W4SL26_9GLOM|nr:18272_t:CDS:10 [Funneliformis geosporum]CAI2174911.1 15184_t:CDS:10 [Funneliformis geosporum]
MATTKLQPQLSLHGRIPHNVLAILASSVNPVEEVEEHIWSIPNENSWDLNSDTVAQAFHTTNNNYPHYLFSTSDSGNHLVGSSSNYIVILSLDETRKEFKVIGEVNECYEAGERITAVLCLPFFTPSAGNSHIFVLVGYNTGYLRIFSEAGNLLISQLLDTSTIIAIKLRTAIFPTYSLPSLLSQQKLDPHSFNEADEEITILFEGGKVVSIDGKSLWLILRICVGSNHYESGNMLISSTGDANAVQRPEGTTSFAFKKWHFEGQENVVDVVSCGPSQHWTANIFDQTFSTTTALFTSNATARFIAVGSDPMLSYYATTDSSRPFLLAVSMVASRVTNAVFSIAKSLLTRTIPTSATGDVSNMPPAKTIPIILSLNDSNRKVLSIVMSPAAADGKYQLAALTDSFGRVTLIDVEEGEIIAMYKGIRNARCGWVEAIEDDDTEDNDKSNEYIQIKSKNDLPSSTSTSSSFIEEIKYRKRSKRITLFLVIYSPLRGIVEIHHMRHGIRVGHFSIGLGWHVVTSASAPLGTSMGGGISFYEQGRRGCRNAGLAKCFLIGPQGEIKRVHVPFGCAIMKPINQINVFRGLLCKYEADTAENKDALLQQLMKALNLITDPRIQLEMLISLPDSLAPTFHLLATQSSIDSMQMLDSLDFLEFIHDIRDQLLKGISQDDKKIIRLELVLRENLLHLYQTLEGWNVESSDNRDNVGAVTGGHNDHTTVADDETFERSVKFHFGGCTNTEEAKHEDETTKGIGPSTFMSSFLLKSLDTPDDGAYLILDNEERKWQLADFLLKPLIISTSPNEWIETIRKRIPISTKDWLGLFLFWFERTSLASLTNFILKDNSNFIFIILNNFSSVTISFEDKFVFSKIINFCLNTEKIGHALLLLIACQYGNPSVDDHEIDWKSLVTKLETCWNLVKDAHPMIAAEIGLTVLNFNKFEKTSLTRISAIKDLKFDGKVNLDEISTSSTSPKSDLYWIYRSWTFGQMFKKDRDNTHLLRIAIEQAKLISDVALRNGLLHLIWNSLCMEQISSINTLVEKARKAPKDHLCIKQCGMGVKMIDSFLLSSRILFESFIWEPEEGIDTSHISNVVESVITIPDDIENRDAYLNDAMGRMCNLFKVDDAQEGKIFNKTLVESLIELIHILLLVFRIEVRMIRPSKLFESNLSFFNSLLITKEENPIGRKYSNSNIEEERMSFVKKLIDKSSDYLEDILWITKKFEINENDIRIYWQSKYADDILEYGTWIRIININTDIIIIYWQTIL